MQSEPWHKSLARILWWAARYVLAPFMAIGGPILAVYGAVHPRDADLAALQLRSGQVPVLVGVSGADVGCTNSRLCDSSGQRLYLIFPHALLGGDLAVVNSNERGLTVDYEPFLAYVILVVWATCVFLTWRYFVYPLLPASNNRLERSRGASSGSQGEGR
jgi:hypothetical protein